MPEIDFDPKHKRQTIDSIEFDRLKLKKDERARIVLLEKPTFAYVHTLRAPKITNGRANKVEKKTRKGDVYHDWEMDFVGRPLCNGDYGTLTDKGVDPDNCPACKRSTTTDEVNPPERRFAVNIIRYSMTRDGRLVKPFSCSCLVWGFTEGIYNRLIDIAQEHGDLLGRDLLLGPCTDEGFQKFEIQAGASPLWKTDDATASTVKETFRSNRVAELERACGRKAEARWMIKDLDQISEKWRVARGEKDGTEAADSQALNDGLGQLLGDQKPGDAVDMSELLGDQTPASDKDAPVTAGVSSGASSGEAFDFDSILNELK